MTEPTPSTANTDKPADEAPKPTTDPVSSLLGSLRDAIDDLAERALPTVREVSARAAEMAAMAADKAGPAVKKAGQATSEASVKLAGRSRDWAAEVRSSITSDARKAPDVTAATAGAADAATEAAKGAADAATNAAKDATEAAKDATEAAADAAEHAAG